MLRKMSPKPAEVTQWGFVFRQLSPASPALLPLTQTLASYWVSEKHLTTTEINLPWSYADPARIQPKVLQN